MEDKYNNLIDLRKIFEAKAPKLMKRMPNWLFRRIQRLLHEEDINRILGTYGNHEGVAFVRDVVKDFNLNIVVKGAENLTASDRILVASNHPLGGLDGIALIGTVGEHCPDPVTPVNDFLMFVKNLQPIFIPVNKAGKGVSDRQENLRLYTITDWNRRRDVLMKVNTFDRKKLDVMRKYLDGVKRVKLDASGRLQIPKELLDRGGLCKDVVIDSMFTNMEIWDKAKYEERVNAISPDELAQSAQELFSGLDFGL